MSKNTDLARYSSNTLSLGGVAVGTNLTITTTSFNVGNSTVNTTANSTIFTGTSLFANLASYVTANSGIVSNSTGVFVKAADGLLANATGLWVSASSGLLVNSTALYVKANTGIIANATGTFVDQSFAPTWTGLQTFSGNVSLGSRLFANSSAGTAGQALISNGTGTYWGTPKQPWHGVVYAAYANCDPQVALNLAITGGSVAATPTNIGATVARIAYFRPPADITINKLRYWGVGTTSGIYTVALYNGDTLAQISAQNTFSTTSATWGAIYSGLNLTLTANQLYFIAVSVNTTGTTAGVLCLSPTITATTGQLAALPKSWPGSLDIDSGYITGAFAQGAVTGGALPNPFPTVAKQAAWTGGMPLFFLDSSNA